MTNRYAYARLNTEETVNRHESSHDHESDESVSTKLRRTINQRKSERWPGSASSLLSLSPDSPRNYIDHVIKPLETLQGLALLYRCSVFDLKIANNIQKESEFFARRVLKIPVRQHSSLTEKVSKEIPTQDLNPSLPLEETQSSSTEYLKQVDEDLQRLKEKARVYDMDGNDSPTVLETNTERKPKRSDCQGDDCGLSWTHVLGLSLLVLLACPLLYFLYLELNLHKLQAASHNVTGTLINQPPITSERNVFSAVDNRSDGS